MPAKHPSELEDPVKPCFAGNPYGFVSPGRRFTGQARKDAKGRSSDLSAGERPPADKASPQGGEDLI